MKECLPELFILRRSITVVSCCCFYVKRTHQIPSIYKTLSALLLLERRKNFLFWYFRDGIDANEVDVSWIIYSLAIYDKPRCIVSWFWWSAAENNLKAPFGPYSIIPAPIVQWRHSKCNSSWKKIMNATQLKLPVWSCAEMTATLKFQLTAVYLRRIKHVAAAYRFLRFLRLVRDLIEGKELSDGELVRAFPRNNPATYCCLLDCPWNGPIYYSNTK